MSPLWGGSVKKRSFAQIVVLATAVLLCSQQHAAAQSTPASPGGPIAFEQQPTVPGQTAIENAVKKYGIGVDAGIGLDPEIIIIGLHGAFGQLFRKDVAFRPGFELGFGELTTELGFNLDVIYTLNDAQRSSGWKPYFGIGPNFALSHRGFSEENDSSTTTTTTSSTDGTTTTEETPDRFDFGDTDFDTGLNFIVGARRSNLFMEMKATAYGVATIRLMAGFDF
jgi:hypothetical protein